MNSMPFRQLKPFLKILIGVQYNKMFRKCSPIMGCFPRNMEKEED